MKQELRNVLVDSVSDLVYYDRKEDEELPRGEIEKMLASGETTLDEIITVYGEALREYFND